jgi:hypothetical protein
MRFRTSRSAIVALALAALAGSGALAQNRSKKNSAWSNLLNVDMMVNTYSQFLVRKYDLNEEQTEYTRQMLLDKANQFMDAHTEDVHALVERMFDVRTGGDMSPEELIAWGKAAMPIYEEAKQAIVQGNLEWREILNDQQRAIHDEDLRLMTKSFTTTEQQLERIVTGDMTVDEFRNPGRMRKRVARSTPVRTGEASEVVTPRPPTETDAERQARIEELRARARERMAQRQAEAQQRAQEAEPQRVEPQRAEPRIAPTPNRNGASRQMENNPDREEMRRAIEERIAERRGSQPEARSDENDASDRRNVTRRSSRTSKSGSDYESKWDAYVEDFIKKYDLTDGQAQKARDILKDCKGQAARYASKAETRTELYDEQMEKLKKDAKANKDAIAKLTEAKAKLLAPIDTIFEKQLKPRLDKLPTRAQRAAAEANDKKANTRSSPRRRRSRRP